MGERNIESDLFRNLLLGHPTKAIDVLYKRYFHSLVNISIIYTKNRKVSEDIVEEVFVFLHYNNSVLAESHAKSIQHYLVRIVKYKSIDSYKEQLKSEKLLNDIQKNANQSEEPIETRLIEIETFEEIRKVISTFPKRERQSLTMRFYEDMSIDQIAVVLKISEKSVERSITSGKKRLKAYWRGKK